MQVHTIDGTGWVCQQGELGPHNRVLMLQYLSFCGKMPTGPALDSPCKPKVLRYQIRRWSGSHMYCEVEGRLFKNCGSFPKSPASLSLGGKPLLPFFILCFVLLIPFQCCTRDQKQTSSRPRKPSLSHTPSQSQEAATVKGSAWKQTLFTVVRLFHL